MVDQVGDSASESLRDLLTELDRFRSSEASLTMEPVRVEDWLRAWGLRVVAALEIAGQRNAATSIRGALRVQAGTVTIALNAQRIDQVRAWLYQAVRQLGGRPAATKKLREADQRPAKLGVFLSYRRRGGWSLASQVHDALEKVGFDAFMDYKNLGSGEFEPVLLKEIAARPHFVLLLGPTSLLGVHEPADWVRREIEHALSLKRDVIPVMFDGFSFKSEEFRTAASQCPSLIQVSRMNSIEIHPEYLEAGLARLCAFLAKKPLTSVSPTPPRDVEQGHTRQQQVGTSSAADGSATAAAAGSPRSGRPAYKHLFGIYQYEIFDATGRRVRVTDAQYLQVLRRKQEKGGCGWIPKPHHLESFVSHAPLSREVPGELIRCKHTEPSIKGTSYWWDTFFTPPLVRGQRFWSVDRFVIEDQFAAARCADTFHVFSPWPSFRWKIRFPPERPAKRWWVSVSYRRGYEDDAVILQSEEPTELIVADAEKLGVGVYQIHWEW